MPGPEETGFQTPTSSIVGSGFWICDSTLPSAAVSQISGLLPPGSDNVVNHGGNFITGDWWGANDCQKAGVADILRDYVISHGCSQPSGGHNSELFCPLQWSYLPSGISLGMASCDSMWAAVNACQGRERSTLGPWDTCVIGPWLHDANPACGVVTLPKAPDGSTIDNFADLESIYGCTGPNFGESSTYTVGTGPTGGGTSGTIGTSPTSVGGGAQGGAIGFFQRFFGRFTGSSNQTGTSTTATGGTTPGGTGSTGEAGEITDCSGSCDPRCFGEDKASQLERQRLCPIDSDEAAAVGVKIKVKLQGVTGNLPGNPKSGETFTYPKAGFTLQLVSEDGLESETPIIDPRNFPNYQASDYVNFIPKADYNTNFYFNDRGIAIALHLFELDKSYSLGVLKNKKWSLFIKGFMHLRRKVCDLKPVESTPNTYKCDKANIVLDFTKSWQSWVPEDGDLYFFFTKKDPNEPVGSNSYEGNVIDLTGITMLDGDLLMYDENGNYRQDGIVDSKDLALIKANLGKPVWEGENVQAQLYNIDLNFDGVIDSQDYNLVLQTLEITNKDE